MPANVLYYGDNLDILRRYIADESVDLVYLDPPFNSNATYNVLFAEQTGEKAASQIKAFEDTWTSDGPAAWSNAQTAEAGVQVSKVELERVLKPMGSPCLHCEPTADAVSNAEATAQTTIADLQRVVTETVDEPEKS